MEAEKLLELWDALEQRRASYIAVADAPSEEAKREAENRLAAAEAQVNELQSNLWNTYPQPYVRCRDIGHVWDVKEENLIEGILFRELQCYRCQSKRNDSINRLGDIINRHYHHAEDYLMPKGGGGSRYGKPFWRGLTYMVVARGR